MSTGDDEPPNKRRKVRKGTQSCWECKRRKVRCTWASLTNPTCDNCLRRKTACISQEYPNEQNANPAKASDAVEVRLNRVERLLEQLAENVSTSRQHDHFSASSRDANGSDTDTMLFGGQQTFSGEETTAREGIDSSQWPPARDMLTPTSISQLSEPAPLSRYTGLARELLAAWPAQGDLDFIYDLPIGLSTHLHMKLSASSSALPTQEQTSPRTMLHLPPPTSHPVLIARKLLLLGSLLQGALSTAQLIPSEKRAHLHAIMSRVFDTASRLVTSNDELIASVEGIECIMIEAMIHNYAGNLHRMWMSTRRASAIAQMMGLHRSGRIHALKILDPGTRENLDLNQLCFRIVEMDRYASMALGLPQSSLNLRPIAPEDLATLQPIDRMARIQCIIAGRIILRTGYETPEQIAADTQDISRLLHEAATAMPSEWWLIPNHSSNSHRTEGSDLFYEVARINYQFSYYHILIRLHLPYMLRSSTDGRYADSKTTAVNASREILTRHIAFRAWNAGLFYCRGIDYLSFIALAVLCLAHIDTRNASSSSSMLSSHMHVAQPMLQSHPSDRAMMERTVSILLDMKNDAIAIKLSRIMQHLLDVEAASASGAEFSAVATTDSDEDPATECDGEFVDGDKTTLQLHIPYFGTINLQRKLVSREMTQAGHVVPSSTADITPFEPTMFTEWDTQWSQLDASNDLGTLDDWTLQSINEGLFSSLFSDVGDADVGFNTLASSMS